MFKTFLIGYEARYLKIFLNWQRN